MNNRDNKHSPYNLKKYVLWVIRESNNGDIKNSAPCNACCKILKKLGFRKVAYSDDSGNMNMVDMRYYMNDHISNSQKATAIHSHTI